MFSIREESLEFITYIFYNTERNVCFVLITFRVVSLLFPIATPRRNHKVAVWEAREYFMDIKALHIDISPTVWEHTYTQRQHDPVKHFTSAINSHLFYFEVPNSGLTKIITWSIFWIHSLHQSIASFTFVSYIFGNTSASYCSSGGYADTNYQMGPHKLI